MSQSAVIPKYRKHAKTGRAAKGFIEINGKRRYFPGAFNSPESLQAYRRWTSEYLASGQLEAAPSRITIYEVCERFLIHAKAYYGSSSEAGSYAVVVGILCRLYGDTEGAQFGPLALKACREEMIAKLWARKSINRQINRIRHIFRWAGANEILPPTVHHGLQCLDGLKAGRSGARESEPIQPVPWAEVCKIKEHVPGVIWNMIEVQYLTGCRPGELCGLLSQSIDCRGTVWRATLTDHKTAYKGKKRTLFFGKQAQAILEPYLLRRPFGYVFSPWDSIQEKSAKATVHRRLDQKPNAKKTSRVVRDYYDTTAFRKAISRGCKNAGIASFHPHQLRHTRATEVRDKYGLDATQALLGHSGADVTQIYAEIDTKKVVQIMGDIG